MFGESMIAFREFMDLVGTAVDGVGVFLIVLGMIVASWRFLLGTQRTTGRSYNRWSLLLPCVGSLRQVGGVGWRRST